MITSSSFSTALIGGSKKKKNPKNKTSIPVSYTKTKKLPQIPKPPKSPV